MSEQVKAVLDQVSKMSSAEQLILVEMIVKGLRETGEELSPLSEEWVQEIENREMLLEEGKMETYSMKEVKARILKNSQKD